MLLQGNVEYRHPKQLLFFQIDIWTKQVFISEAPVSV